MLEYILANFRKQLRVAGASDVVINLTGEFCSTVLAMLCTIILGKAHVYGVKLHNGVYTDVNDINEVVDTLGIRAIEVNSGEMLNTGLISTERALTDKKLAVSAILPGGSRLKDLSSMCSIINLYMVAAKLGSSCKVADDYFLQHEEHSYASVWTNTRGDVSLLGKLTKTEVEALGLDIAPQFGIRDSLVLKKYKLH